MSIIVSVGYRGYSYNLESYRDTL